jgi:chemotaxis protein MotB
MIFFVVMYALSNVDAQKFKAVSEALSKSLGAGGGMVLNYPGSSAIQTPTMHNQADFARENEQMENMVSDLREYIHKNNLDARISVANEERGVVVSFQDPVLFPSGSAEMVPSAASIIQGVGRIIVQSDNYVRVEGHTDNMPINNALFPSNWELSSARATRIVQVLIREIGFPPQRLSATAYGEYRPRAPNNSEPNRQLNRRVDIVVLRNKYKGAEYGNVIPGEDKIIF